MPGWYHEEQGSDGPNSGGGSDNSGPQSLSDMSSSSSQSGFAGFDVERASYLRTVHGILALVAFVALFPLGAVLMRLVPGRMSIWFHAVTQLAALALFIASIGLGAYIVNLVQDGGFPLVSESEDVHGEPTCLTLAARRRPGGRSRWYRECAGRGLHFDANHGLLASSLLQESWAPNRLVLPTFSRRTSGNYAWHHQRGHWAGDRWGRDQVQSCIWHRGRHRLGRVDGHSDRQRGATQPRKEAHWQ